MIDHYAMKINEFTTYVKQLEVCKPYSRLYNWMYPSLTEDQEAEASRLLGIIGDDMDLPAEPADGDLPMYQEEPGISRTRRDAFVVTCSQMAKNKFPLNKRSEANRQVVRKYISDIMVERGMRPQHIRASLDLAVALTFTRDQYDVEVEAFELSEAYRRNAPQQLYGSTPGWWPFRTRISRPGYSTA
jgi:hypothetical protein